MNVIWGVPNAAEFVAARCNIRTEFGECQKAGVFDGNKMIAAVVFHNWSPEYGVIEVSAAADSPKWASRTVLRQLFGYAFGVAQMVVARTDEDNLRTRRLWKAFGATEYIIPRLRGREASEAVECLTDDAWIASRFMRQEYGQTQGSKAA